eukprot:458311_1
MRHSLLLAWLIALFTLQQLVLCDNTEQTEDSVNVEINSEGETNEMDNANANATSSNNTSNTLNDVETNDTNSTKNETEKEDFKLDPQIFYDYFMKMYATNPAKQKQIKDLFKKYEGQDKELMDILMKMMQEGYGGGYGGDYGGYGGGGYGGYGGGYGGYGGYGGGGYGDYGRPPRKPKIKKTGKKYIPENSHLRATSLGEVELFDDFDDDDTDLPFIIWMAPFFSGGGYCSEALSYIEYLSYIDETDRKISIGHHGDSFDYEYFYGLSEHHRQLMVTLDAVTLPIPYIDTNKTIIVICHSEPGAWFPPNYQTSACPPFINVSLLQESRNNDKNGEPQYNINQIMRMKNVYYIGRTMFETDRLPHNWDYKLNIMDEIWVPTQFHYNIFNTYANLTNNTKLWILPQSVNTTFYSPNYSLTKNDILNNLQLNNLDIFKSDPFIFLSVFKWEERKGWKYLLQAYLSEFSENDNVELLILTNAYHTTDDFDDKIQEFIRNDTYLSQHLGNNSNNDQHIERKIASLHVVPNKVANELMPQLYQLGNCFVLPSRGEGWGRPHVEAMSIGLPIIATNWSGPTEYIKHGYNGYLIKVDMLEEIKEGSFKGHKWAKPNIDHLKKLMRDVFNAKDYVKNIIGKNAQITMRKKYCIDCIGKILVNKFKSLAAKIESSKV